MHNICEIEAMDLLHFTYIYIYISFHFFHGFVNFLHEAKTQDGGSNV